jgi:hypothetical protein
MNNLKKNLNNTENKLYKFKFIDESKFSTKTGNNTSPGKYGDYELYLMGLITEEELLNRKNKIYKQLLDNNTITETEYKERVESKEVVRTYDKVVKYIINRDKDNQEVYYSGIPIKYNINEVKELTKSIRPMSIKTKYRGLVVVLTPLDIIPLNILDDYTKTLKYFSSNEIKTNPYNFYTATEQKARFFFNDLSKNAKFENEPIQNNIPINQTYKNGDIYQNCEDDITKKFFKDNNIKYYSNYNVDDKHSFKTMFKIEDGYLKLTTDKTVLSEISIKSGTRTNSRSNIFRLKLEKCYEKIINFTSATRYFNIKISNKDYSSSFVGKISGRYELYTNMTLKDIEEFESTLSERSKNNYKKILEDYKSNFSEPINILNNSYLRYKNFTDEDFNYFKLNETDIPSYYKDNLYGMGIYENDMLCIIKCSYDLINDLYKSYLRKYYFRTGIQQLILNQFNLDFDYIFFSSYPNINSMFLFVKYNNLSFPNYKGSIIMKDVKNIKTGPSLHEILHYYGNNALKTPSVSFHSEGNINNLTYFKYKPEFNHIISPHWGFSNINGHLGGFSELNIINLTNESNLNYPVIDYDTLKLIISIKTVPVISTSSITTTAKPVVQTTTAKPVVQTTTAKPVVQTTTAKPIVQTTTAKSIVQTTTAKPVVQTTTAKSVVQTTTAKPIVQTTTAKPVVQTTTVIKKNAIKSSNSENKDNIKIPKILKYLLVVVVVGIIILIMNIWKQKSLNKK